MRNRILTGLLTSATSLAAQPESRFADLLPAGAQVIETETVKTAKSRTLVLWMQNPKRIVSDGSGCVDGVYGDYWIGPAHLSLIDIKRGKLFNTIRVQGFYPR